MCMYACLLRRHYQFSNHCTQKVQKSRNNTAMAVALLTKLVASMLKWRISSSLIALRVCVYVSIN